MTREHVKTVLHDILSVAYEGSIKVVFTDDARKDRQAIKSVFMEKEAEVFFFFELNELHSQTQNFLLVSTFLRKFCVCSQKKFMFKDNLSVQKMEFNLSLKF